MDTGADIVGVHGAGAWGTALAIVAARAGRRVVLVGRDAAALRDAATTRRPPRLPEAVLPAGVEVTAEAGRLAACGLVVLAVPAQATRGASALLADVLAPGTAVVVASKGIERDTGLLVADVAAGAWRRGPVAVLSGPGFAAEVAAGLPTAVTVAAGDLDLADRIAALLAGPSFRPYTTDDVTGVQLGGALKNVLAIAAGIVGGRRLGASAEAAVITRGFVEMRRLAEAMGARPETLMGLSGLGDLVLTCRSTQSRNFSLGVGIGAGEDPTAFGRLAEGAATAAIAVERAAALAVETPIMDAVAQVLDARLTVDGAVDRLLARPLRRETHP